MRSEYEMQMMRDRLGRLFRHLAYELRMNARSSRKLAEQPPQSEPVDYRATPPSVSMSLQTKLAEIAAENG
jgi:hypothetical protein